MHLPDTGPVASFTFRGRCRLDRHQWAPATALTGLRETVRHHEHFDRHAVVLVQFEPMGAAAFLRPGLDELSRRTTDLADIFAGRDRLDHLLDCLAKAPNHRRRVETLESFLLARLRLSAPDPLLSAALRWIEGMAGPKRMEQLTRYIGLSQSALERRFRRTIGLSPKKFASVIRLRHAVQLMSTEDDLAAVANAAGYFDQSHFINDFRRAMGRTPTAYLKDAPADWSQLFPVLGSSGEAGEKPKANGDQLEA
ncbi:MAG TPA: helix-turn-helix transcriptional regulator [Opitutus sp.]|nr:helix-turn-helix transcriptional regulator [Opitutus sp.]